MVCGSGPLRNALRNCTLQGNLEKDPLKRMKISDILRHSWMQDIPEKINVFTDQEKEKIISEFAYYNFKNDSGSNPGEVIHTDPFTEQMLNST
jgi:serine/threonine protein kinase